MAAAFNRAPLTKSQSHYYSAQQSELSPTCKFFPKHTRDISQALSDVLWPNNVSIAISSGGQSSKKGGSNIDNGITIDLSKLNSTSLEDHNQVVVLGAGARWKDVYAKLAKRNLTVPGDRDGEVGVGGHVLGGGISWFANEVGWTCDSVLEFEVVTPQGQVLWASRHANEDIFFALKGSLGAFGIVTKIKLPTLPDREAYGGSIDYAAEQVPSLFNALQRLADSANRYPSQAGCLSSEWIESKRVFTYRADLMNVDGNKNNPALAAFEDILHSSSTINGVPISSTNLGFSDSNAKGLRRAKFTLTSKCIPSAMQQMHDLVQEFAPKVKFDQKGFLSVTYQPLTIPHLQAQAQSNTFDLSYVRGPLLLISVEFSWGESSRDEHIEGSAKHLKQAMEAQLKASKSYHAFVYPSYAAKDQDPFASLTSYTKGYLKAIKNRYDPDDMWGRHVPGLWHI